MPRWSLFLLSLLVCNSILVWIALGWWWQSAKQTVVSKEVLSGELKSNDATVSTLPPQIEASSTSDQALIASISALQSRIDILEASNAAKKTVAPAQKSSGTSTTPKEYYIHMGSGSTNNQEWVDINSTAVAVDTASYSGYKTVAFEVTLSIVSGEAYARLKNKTTGAILSASEVLSNSSTSTRKTSGTFWLHPGNNEYVVQLRSSNGESAQLGEARLKLLVN